MAHHRLCSAISCPPTLCNGRQCSLPKQVAARSTTCLAYHLISIPLTRYTVEISYTDQQRKELGDAIAKARKGKGLTVCALAKQSGITATNLSRIENGNYNVGIDIISRICAALGATLRIDF